MSLQSWKIRKSEIIFSGALQVLDFDNLVKPSLKVFENSKYNCGYVRFSPASAKILSFFLDYEP